MIGLGIYIMNESFMFSNNNCIFKPHGNIIIYNLPYILPLIIRNNRRLGRLPQLRVFLRENVKVKLQ